jgi:hypothetical protein
MKPEDKAKIQQALEALESFLTDDLRPIRADKAIAALRQLLEQPVQEPVEMREVLVKIARFLDVVRVYAQDIQPKNELETDKPLHWKARELQDEVIRLLDTTPQAQPAPVQEPKYWDVVDPAGNIVASETDAIRGWARIAGSYKPTVEGLLGLHDQGWRVLPKVAPPAQPEPVQEPDAVVTGHYGGNCVVTPTDPSRVFNTGTVFYTQPTDHSEQHLDMVDHGDELTIAYLDGVHTGKQIAKREWVGLTDEERRKLFDPLHDAPFEFAKRIESKLKEKNT